MREKPSIWAGLSLEPAHIWHILLAVWILVMFGHSMTPADLSSKESGSVLAFLCSMLEGAGIGSSWLTEHLVRKTAHFCEYGVFGLLLMKNFYLLQGRRGRGYRQSLTARFCPLVLAVLAVPFLDETIQSFSPGRSPQIGDVWLDMAGACCGLLAAAVLKRLWGSYGHSRRRRRRFR